MPEYDFDDDNTEDDNDRVVTLKRSEIRALEKKAKAADEALARAERMERTEAFRTAGIDPASKRFSYFVKGYDGELTAEAIKQAAIEAELMAAEEEGEQVPADEQAAHKRLSEASAGTEAPPPIDFNERLSGAKSEAEVMALIRESGMSVAE